MLSWMALAIAADPPLPLDPGLEISSFHVDLQGLGSMRRTLAGWCELLDCTVTPSHELDELVVVAPMSTPTSFARPAVVAGVRRMDYAVDGDVITGATREGPLRSTVFVQPPLPDQEDVLAVLSTPSDDPDDDALIGTLLAVIDAAEVDEDTQALVWALPATNAPIPWDYWVTGSGAARTVDRRLFEGVARNPSLLGRPTGRLGKGVRIFNKRMAALGVTTKHRILAVDGTRLTSTEEWTAVVRGLLTGDRVVLTLAHEDDPKAREVTYTLVGDAVALPDGWEARRQTLDELRWFAGITREGDRFTFERSALASWGRGLSGRFAVHHGDDGAVDGLVVHRAVPGDPLTLLGIGKRGDVVSRIGDVALTGGPSLEKAVRAVLSEAVDVDVVVNGRTLTWTIAGGPVPVQWQRIVVRPSVVQERRSLGIEVDGDVLVVPRAVVKDRWPRYDLRPHAFDVGYVLWDRRGPEPELFELMGLPRGARLFLANGVPVDAEASAEGALRSLLAESDVAWSWAAPRSDRKREGERLFTTRVRVTGAPLPADAVLVDAEPSDADLRREAGVRQQDGVWIVPRAVVDELPWERLRPDRKGEGLRVVARGDDRFVLLGLRPTDVLLKCYGAPLTDGSVLEGCFAAGQVDLTLRRGRDELTVRYRIE